MFKNSEGLFIWKMCDLYAGFSELITYHADSAVESNTISAVLKLIAAYRLSGTFTDEEVQQAGLHHHSYTGLVCQLAKNHAKLCLFSISLLYLAILVFVDEIETLIEAAVIEIDRDVRYNSIDERCCYQD